VQQAVISTLDFVAAPALAAEAILPTTQEAYKAAEAALEQVARAGRVAGLTIRYWLASPPETGEEEYGCDSGAAIGLPWLVAQRPTCTENIHRSAFIGADGAVSPCVYTAVPVAEASCVVGDGEHSYARMSFGNIHEAPFEAIWRSSSYAGFRAAHRRGDLPDRCRDCPRPRMGAGE
jgi:MoaA/NifB/PqqE/SkfB family radical SAM enzyme